MHRLTAPRWPLVGRASELDRLGEIALASSRGGVVIAGPAGVGKTRLAVELLELTARQGFETATASASESAATIPLGALSPLLPPLPDHRGPAELLRQARAAIAERARGGRLALFVDDAHRLDDMSATVVCQLASGGDAFVIATVRSEAQAPDAVVALWKDEIADRIELRPLDNSSVEDLLRTVLGGNVDAGALRRFTDVSGGNPLFLRELFLAASENELLKQENGLWRLVGPLAVSTRLVEIVTARLTRTERPERAALEVIAFGAPMGLGVLERRFGRKVLHALEGLELVTVAGDGRRLQVSLTHPLYGEVMRSLVPAMRARAVNRELADMLRSGSMRRRDDGLRLGTWLLEGGGHADAGLLLAAAQAARSRWDLSLAERLAEGSLRAGGGFDAGLLVAQLQLLRGHPQEAERSLTALVEEVRTDAERVALTTTLIDTLAFGLGRHGDALQVALDAEGQLTADDALDQIVAKRAELLHLAGATESALDALAPILRRSTGRAVAQVAPAAGLCLVLLGRLTEAIEVSARGHAAYLANEGLPLTFGAYLPLLVQGVALGHAGRLAEAHTLALSEYERALADNSLEARAVFAELSSWISLLHGRPATAQQFAAEATALHRQLGWGPFVRFALANLAQALAVLGAADDARRVIAELDSLGIPDTDVSGGLIVQARAWVRIAAGDLAGGRAELQRASDVARESGDRVGEAAALHDLARTGRPGEAVDRLIELTSFVEGELVQARAAHVVALSSGDAAALEAVSVRFEAMGAKLFAAEARAAAAVSFRRAGDQRGAAAAKWRLGELLRNCEGAVTPALAEIGAQAVLTPAELRVAGLAAAGMSNKTIALQLRVTVRTVETQLQRVYDKLAVHSRSDLPGVLKL